MNDVADLGTILSVWAHPDDETYLAGGVMAAAAERGQRVVCVSATAGEHGTDDTATWPPERLRAVRRWEAAAAMAVLGVAEHHLLGLPDGRVAESEEEGRAAIGRLIDEVAPDTILTFGPDGVTFHPDHLAVHRMVTEAWEERARPSRLLYAAETADHLRRFRRYYEEAGIYMAGLRPVGVPTSALAVQTMLRGRDLDRKLTALRAMATQTGPVMAETETGIYVSSIAQEAFVDAARRPGRATGDLRLPAVAA